MGGALLKKPSSLGFGVAVAVAVAEEDLKRQKSRTRRYFQDEEWLR
jgi:hypothetical protein